MSLVSDSTERADPLRLDKHARIMVVRSPAALNALPTWEPHDVTFHLLLHTADSIELTSGGQHRFLSTGQFVVVPSRASKVVRLREGATVVALSFPSSIVEISLSRLESICGEVIDASQGVPAAFASLLQSLVDVTTSDSQVSLHLSDAVTALLAATLVDAADESYLSSAGRSEALFLAVRRWIEERLGEPGLTVTTIAAANHISSSYLQKLFASEGGNVSGWIRERRCERCRRDLADPQQLHVSIGVIANRWGFPSPAHFSRVFTSHYGITPSAYRAASVRPSALSTLATGEDMRQL